MKRSRIQSFSLGISLPFHALRLILSQRRLLVWAAIPVIITFSLYGVLIFYLEDQVQNLFNHVLTYFGLSLQSWMGTLFRILTYLALLLVSALTFSFMGGIVACPFNDLLAEQAEPFVYPPLSPIPRRSTVEKLGIIFLDLYKNILAILGNLVMLLLSWLPIVGLLAIGMTFLFFAFQFISYAQTRRNQGVRMAWAFIWTNFYACFGFGLIASFMLSIPIFSCFALPLLVVGGTLLVAHDQRDQS